MAEMEGKTYFSRYRLYYSLVSPLIATEKAKAYTMIILSLLALSFFGFFAMGPTLTTITELRKKVEDAELVDKKLQNKISNLSELQKAYPGIVSDVPIIYDALPPQGRPANLLGKIQALANRFAITLNSVQVQQVKLSGKDTESVSLFSFILSGAGGYADIYSFLKNLSNLDRIVTVENFTISKAQTKEEGERLLFSLKGTAYVLFE